MSRFVTFGNQVSDVRSDEELRISDIIPEVPRSVRSGKDGESEKVRVTET